MKSLTIFLIRFYQYLHELIQPLLYSLFGFTFHCAQKPSCSEFTIREIQKHGTITGLKNGLWRVLHCY